MTHAKHALAGMIEPDSTVPCSRPRRPRTCGALRRERRRSGDGPGRRSASPRAVDTGM